MTQQQADGPGTVDNPGTFPGLSAGEVAERVAAGQVNALPDKSGRTIGEIVRANVFTRINAILGILFVIVATTGSLKNGLFALILVTNSGIGIFQEVRAKKTLDALAIVGQTRPMVRRDGVAAELPPDEVVLDDIIELGSGDQVVVDGEVVAAAALEVDVSRVIESARAFDGRRVRAQGTVVNRRFVERGEVPVLSISDLRLSE